MVIRNEWVIGSEAAFGLDDVLAVRSRQSADDRDYMIEVLHAPIVTERVNGDLYEYGRGPQEWILVDRVKDGLRASAVVEEIACVKSHLDSLPSKTKGAKEARSIREACALRGADAGKHAERGATGHGRADRK